MVISVFFSWSLDHLLFNISFSGCCNSQLFWQDYQRVSELGDVGYILMLT